MLPHRLCISLGVAQSFLYFIKPFCKQFVCAALLVNLHVQNFLMDAHEPSHFLTTVQMLCSSLGLIIAIFQGTRARSALPSSLWEAQRTTRSTCGLYTTSPAATQRTFPSRRGRSSSFSRSQRSSGGAPRIKKDALGWSPCPMWRNWFDRCLIPASPHMVLATPTAMGSRSPPTRLSTPMLSPRHRRRCPPERPEWLTAPSRPCRTARSWRRPSRNECHAHMTKRRLL